MFWRRQEFSFNGRWGGGKKQKELVKHTVFLEYIGIF